MDQNRLAGTEMSAVDEPFPGGDEDERQGGGLAHGQICGLFRQQFGVDRGVFGERSLPATDAAGHAEHLVATPERGHVGADRLDDACKIDPEHGRKRLPCMWRLARVDFEIKRVDGAGLDTNQHLARARDWLCERGQSKRRIWCVENGGVHLIGGRHDNLRLCRR